jgi:hypothetical protein
MEMAKIFILVSRVGRSSVWWRRAHRGSDDAKIAISAGQSNQGQTQESEKLGFCDQCLEHGFTGRDQLPITAAESPSRACEKLSALMPCRALDVQ